MAPLSEVFRRCRLAVSILWHGGLSVPVSPEPITAPEPFTPPPQSQTPPEIPLLLSQLAGCLFMRNCVIQNCNFQMGESSLISLTSCYNGNTFEGGNFDFVDGLFANCILSPDRPPVYTQERTQERYDYETVTDSTIPLSDDTQLVIDAEGGFHLEKK